MKKTLHPSNTRIWLSGPRWQDPHEVVSVRISVSQRFDFVVLQLLAVLVLPFAKVELNRNCVKIIIINVLGPSFIDMFVVYVRI